MTSLPTADQLNNNEESTLLKEVRRLNKRVTQLEGRANAKTNFANAAGAHVIVGTGNPFNIEDPFTGTAILYPAYADASGNYHIFGMSAGRLQWGANSDNGKIVFGGGDGWLDEFGLTFKNQEGFVQFLDSAGQGTMFMYSDGGDWLVFENSGGGKGITFLLDDASHVVKQFDFNPDGEIVIDGDVIYPVQNTESVLGGTFTITGTAGTFQDTGLSVTLPAAGTYRITGDVRGNLRGNVGTTWWLSAKLFNSTDAADVTNSERIVVLTNVNTILLQQTCPINKIVTVTASKVIKLYAARDGVSTPSWTNSAIESNSAGRTVLSWEKIG